jgi:hypothetical protein
MRDRLVDYLPLLLAVGLIAIWFGFQRPLPWLPQVPPAPSLGVLAAPTPTAVAGTTGVARATALLALCDASKPRFLGSIANLKSRLDARMGDPTDCERPVDAEGNTQQPTTTGLAYYRRALNLAVFTTGWDHWALVDGGIVHWAGPNVEPPGDATPDP